MQKHLDNYLEAPDGAAKVLAHARLLLRLAHMYQTLAPAHLGNASHLANYKSGIIVIHAASGAIAAKLRQLGPTLAEGFSVRGIECSGVQVKVQVADFAKQSTTSSLKPISARSGQTLADLRNTLPDTPLRAALDHLLERAAIRG